MTTRPPSGTTAGASQATSPGTPSAASSVPAVPAATAPATASRPQPSAAPATPATPATSAAAPSTPTGVPSVLARIIEVKRSEIEQGRARLDDEAQHRQALRAVADDPRRGFVRAIEAQAAQAAANRTAMPAIIAEIKRASPSRGIIRDPFDPVAIAQSYRLARATCLSVLTDEQFFQGSGTYLKVVRATCPLPLLRKDFIIDAWQIDEAAVLGADAILLIVAALDAAMLQALYRHARELGLDVLVEVHDAAELDVALTLDDALIGINNRNLHTFDVTLDTTRALLPRIPAGRTVVTESGVLVPADLHALRDAGIHAFLIGEAFMRAPDPGIALRGLVDG